MLYCSGLELNPQYLWDMAVIWKVKKQNQGSEKVKLIYTKRGRGILDGEEPGSLKEEERKREGKKQKGMSFEERTWSSLEQSK